jgi:hypothetical protein
VEAGDRIVGLHVLEGPQMLFLEVMPFTLPLWHRHTWLKIDERFTAAIVPGSLQVVGLVGNQPIDLSAEVCQDHIRISCRRAMHPAIHGHVTLSGIAAGHEHRRLPEFTAEQKANNDAFWRKPLVSSSKFQAPET